MGPRGLGHGRPGKARGWRAADQARPALLLALLAAIVLPGCGGRLEDINPVPGFRNLFGAHLEGREPPPGLDRPWPKLSTVPERPVPPDPAMRSGLSAALAGDRERSRAPQLPGISGVPDAPRPAAEGGPPPPPRLAAVPAIRFEPSSPAAPAAQAVPRPPVPQPAPQPAPSAAAPSASAPPAAIPPAPGPDLLAPPPPPSSDLLAPRGQ